MESDHELIERLKALEEKATKGPWEICDRGGLGFDVDGPDDCDLSGARGMFASEDDASLTAEARNALPRLLALAAKGLEAEEHLRLLREALQEMVACAEAHGWDNAEIENARQALAEGETDA